MQCGNKASSSPTRLHHILVRYQPTHDMQYGRRRRTVRRANLVQCSSDAHWGLAARPQVAPGPRSSGVQSTIGSSTAASPPPVAPSSMVQSTQPEYAAAHISSGGSSRPADVQFWQRVFAGLAHVLPARWQRIHAKFFFVSS